MTYEMVIKNIRLYYHTTSNLVLYFRIYEYEAVKRLLESDKRCSFIPYNTSGYFKGNLLENNIFIIIYSEVTY